VGDYHFYKFIYKPLNINFKDAKATCVYELAEVEVPSANATAVDLDGTEEKAVTEGQVCLRLSLSLSTHSPQSYRPKQLCQ
jgi:hypothetical protein